MTKLSGKKPGMAELNKKHGTKFKRGMRVRLTVEDDDLYGRIGVVTGTSCEFFTVTRNWGTIWLNVRFPGYKNSFSLTPTCLKPVEEE